MTFKPSRNATQAERILGYGDTKTGKSSMWLDIALHMVNGGSPGHMYIVDTDVGAEAAFEFYPELRDVITVYPIYEFMDLQRAVEEIKKIGPDAKNGDWVVGDMFSYFWTEVRAFYTEAFYGQSMLEYIIETRSMIAEAKRKKEGGTGREFGDWEGKDWDAMAKIYHSLESPLTLRCRAHVLGIAEERSATENDRGVDAKTVKLWKRAGGYKPYGHKSLPHHFRTLIRVTNPGSSREYTLAGDRHRETMWEEHGKSRGGITTLQVGDMDSGEGFVQTYLVPIAGWRYRETRGE